MTSQALITGAGCGIGFEIATQLAASGSHVLLNDIDEELCRDAAEKINQSAGHCTPMPGDCSSLAFIESMVRHAASLGPITQVIANAGITTYGSFLDFQEAQFDRLTDINLKGTFFLIQKASEQMIKQKSKGRVLVMSSVTGVQAHADLVAYGMTKAALRMLTRGLVTELTPHGILINCIAPGAVETERTLADQPNYRELWGSVYPTGRPCLPQDIARAALFLVSPENEMINGQTLIIDGGWTSIGQMPK